MRGEQPAPAATIDVSEVVSIAGRETLYTHSASERVVGRLPPWSRADQCERERERECEYASVLLALP